MAKKILISLFIIILGFIAYVASRPNHFRYERSGLIHASPEKIFPYLRNFKLGNEWVPFNKIDPNVKQTFTGPAEGVGAGMVFVGNSQVGEGKIEILSEVPNSVVQMKLEMFKPMKGVNTVEYTLTPDTDGTKFTWAMWGDQPFLGKLVGVFIDCEKMVGDQFEKGIQNLTTLVETKNSKMQR